MILKSGMFGVIFALFVLGAARSVAADCPVNTPALGTARDYAVLGASTVTNTGNTKLIGNLGLSPGSSITGFPPGVYSGIENIANAAAVTAQSSALTAFTDLQGRPAGTTESLLDGLVLGPGTYTSASSMSLASTALGTLSLDAKGNQSAVWVFQIGSTLTTGAGGIATIQLVNGSCAGNVYWQVGSSATINVTPNSVFLGNVIASTSVTVDSGSITGSVVALNGAVTISAASNINATLCCAATPPSASPTSASPTSSSPTASSSPTSASPSHAPTRLPTAAVYSALVYFVVGTPKNRTTTDAQCTTASKTLAAATTLNLVDCSGIVGISTDGITNYATQLPAATPVIDQNGNVLAANYSQFWTPGGLSESLATIAPQTNATYVLGIYQNGSIASTCADWTGSTGNTTTANTNVNATSLTTNQYNGLCSSLATASTTTPVGYLCKCIAFPYPPPAPNNLAPGAVAGIVVGVLAVTFGIAAVASGGVNCCRREGRVDREV